MRLLSLVTACLVLSVLAAACATAEVVYTQIDAAVPVNGSYPIDLNHDGVPDFTLRSRLLQSYCQSGDGYSWNLGLTPGRGSAVVATSADYATALVYGNAVDAGQNFSADTATLAELDWGYCGRGQYGQWLNLPNRYLGLEFRLPGSPDVHYGWAKVSEVVSVDRNGHLSVSTIVQAFAYETVTGRRIAAGQTQ